ncbi:division/cell wall cluster transcriptional repressor MraZ [Varunaivibrio sulfuroxidans]|uniref:Transcriptional regulator MraZ n=1 Tax=Varunaivibrio sulfuroxidans TaxID=1773489 RepID=A0A4R3JAT5_9PROT|nr:division/cell wall cluster transcriptional repressor MraZ [Varunaivibrio sulfuroxidans]TCS62186.1 MraZ protein [Varunaivibrio sulfuroxidans]WES30613.1 division/cell wall cluster transcriptional repressor MraZ [Varunaivibrio sulfuroxidans]
MALLVGRHINKIDKKGRVSVPKVFRAALTDSGFAGIYAFPFFKFHAIEACGEHFMQRLSDSLDDNLDLFSDDQDDIVAITLENAHQLAFDPEGRITLPEELMSYAGLSDQALFVGRGARFRIWSPGAYEENRAQAFARARVRGATVKLGPAAASGAGSNVIKPNLSEED